MWVKHDWKTGQENRDAGMKTDKPTKRERGKKKHRFKYTRWD